MREHALPTILEKASSILAFKPSLRPSVVLAFVAIGTKPLEREDPFMLHRLGTVGLKEISMWSLMNQAFEQGSFLSVLTA